MKTMILDEAESHQSLKNFFEEQAVNPYDYIVVTAVTDDIEFQNELLQMFEHLRKWTGNCDNFFTYDFTNGNSLNVTYYENDLCYTAIFKDKFQNSLYLEHYIQESVFENWEG